MLFEAERFERVAAGSGAVLLRVAGRWRSATERNLGPASLRVDDGRAIHCLEALPGPDVTTVEADRGGRAWRAAFAAPAELLDGGPRAFSVQAADVVVPLPAPAPRRVPRRTPEREEAGQEAVELRAQVDELKAHLETVELGALDAQASVDERLEAAQAEASAERARAERLEQELAQARAEVRALREAARPSPLPARSPAEGQPARQAAPTIRRPGSGSAASGLPAEWLVALVLLGVGVVVVLVLVLTGALL